MQNFLTCMFVSLYKKEKHDSFRVSRRIIFLLDRYFSQPLSANARHACGELCGSLSFFFFVSSPVWKRIRFHFWFCRASVLIVRMVGMFDSSFQYAT